MSYICWTCANYTPSVFVFLFNWTLRTCGWFWWQHKWIYMKFTDDDYKLLGCLESYLSTSKGWKRAQVSCAAWPLSPMFAGFEWIYMGGSINGGMQNSWFIVWKIPIKWMIWGYPYSGNLHIPMCNICHIPDAFHETCRSKALKKIDSWLPRLPRLLQLQRRQKRRRERQKKTSSRSWRTWEHILILDD